MNTYDEEEYKHLKTNETSKNINKVRSTPKCFFTFFNTIEFSGNN